MDDLTVIGNQIEALLWFGFAVGFAWKGCTSRSPERRRLSWVLAVAFAAFGVSDLIEASTGAWWRPFWLFLLKAGCVAVFAYAFGAFRNLRKQERTNATAQPLDHARR
ncbi:MAG: hypothetical protein IT580_24190 [Verrucomicrobiales bacterium]|nr:hypothetical protein [Verrucomicrobiales bacterium]